jgi:hypothetical protein
MTAVQRCETYGCDLPPDHDGHCMVAFADVVFDDDLRDEIANAEIVDLTEEESQ